MGLFSRQTGPSQQLPVVFARTVGSPKVQVVGESYNLASIAKAVGYQPGEHMMRATLVREFDNRHDPNAVRVDVNGLTGGHIPRERASSYHSLLNAALQIGCAIQVGCRVWYRPQPDQMASITLDMVEPALAWPINSVAPSPTVAVWPEGRAVKVSLTDGVVPAIQHILSRAYEPGACAAFMRIDNGAADGRLTLTYDGQPVGTLMPAVSKQMAPVLNAAAQRGRAVFVLAEVTGNSLAADVKARMVPAEKLTEAEIHALIG